MLAIGLAVTNWKNASLTGEILYVVMMGFSVANIVFYCIIYSYREKNTIYDKKNKTGLILAYLGFAFTIIILILCIIAESFIFEEIYRVDHPCWNYNFKEFEICNENSQFYLEKVKDKDKNMSYACCTIVEIFALFGIFFWYNDARRIKYFIKDTEIKSQGGILYGAFGGYLGKYNGNGLYKGMEEKYYDKDGTEIDINKSNKKPKLNKKKRKKRNSSTNTSNVETFNIKQSQGRFTATDEENDEYINTNKSNLKKSGNKSNIKDNNNEMIEVEDI